MARSASRFHVFIAIAGVGMGMTAPLTAVYARELGASDAAAGLAVASVGLSLLPLDVFGTRLVPHLDGRVAITMALAIFGVGSLASAVAPGYPFMLAARIFQGLGGGLFMTGGLQVAARTAPAGREGRAVGAFMAALFLGIAAGPLAGGAVSALASGIQGLRAAFAVCAAVNVAAAVMCRLGLPAMPSGRRPFLSLPNLGALRRPRRLPGVLLLGGLGQGMLVGVPFTLLPLYATQRLHLGPLAVSAALSALAVTNIASMLVAGRVSDRRGRLMVLLPALVWGAAVVWLTALVGSLPAFIVCCAAIGITVGSFSVVPAIMVVDLASERTTGIAGFRICADLGMLGGGAGAGMLVGLAGGRAALEIAGVALLGTALLALRLGETRAQPRRLDEGGSHQVSVPTRETVAALAENQGLSLSAERLDQAAANQAGLRPRLLLLRALPLSFLEPVVEPATALRWIQRGGRSS
jgi:MFS family permease